MLVGAAEVEIDHTDPLPVAHAAEVQTTAAPSTAAITTTAGDLFTLAAGEHAFLQNLGPNPVFVRRATGASTSAFHYVLAGSGALDDGTGGALRITDHLGVLSVAGTALRLRAQKISTL
jgi:hypothetical protein